MVLGQYDDICVVPVPKLDGPMLPTWPTVSVSWKFHSRRLLDSFWYRSSIWLYWGLGHDMSAGESSQMRMPKDSRYRQCGRSCQS